LTAWQELLSEACERVQNVASKESTSKRRGVVVGKGAAGDRTLAVDRSAEREIIDVLSDVPSLRILSEEEGVVGRADAKLVAVVDPIDGSSNFARGLPFYCTSIAILEGVGLRDVKYAIVRNLVSGEVYYAEKGAGATKDGKKIATSVVKNLAQAVVGIDLSRAGEGTISDLVPLMTKIKRQVHLGANALEFCLLAEGKLDATIDMRRRIRVTDVAGGYLISQEAGATVTTPEGSELNPSLDLAFRFSYVASANERVHAQILNALT
jgi:myo-inositol-1(or 4)-monophosphatase